MRVAGLAPLKERCAADDAAGTGGAPAAANNIPRCRTYRASGTPCSRIDDILVATAHPMGEASCAVYDKSGWETDHNLLMGSIPWPALGMEPPLQLEEPDPSPPREVLAHPISKANWDRFRRAFATECARDLAALEHDTRAYVHGDVAPHWRTLLATRDAAEPHALETLDGGGTRTRAPARTRGY